MIFALISSFKLISQDLSEIDYNLILAAETGDSTEVTNLIDSGANVNATTYDGITPLMYACDNNHYTIAKILILNSADVNAIPQNSITSLLSTAINGNWEIGELLIQYNANINLGDKEGMNPLHYASYFGNYYYADMLLYYDANINAKDNKGKNALHYAVLSKDLDIIDLLISKGININARDDYGNTILMTAVAKENTEIIKILLENGADVNILNDEGMTALTYAVITGSKEICKLLIKNGAKIDNNLNSSHDLFYYTKNRDLKKYLKENGAKPDRKPVFNKLETSFNTTFNDNDVVFGLESGLNEAKYNFNITGGYALRPWVRRIQVQRNENEYFQYWERRSFFWLGLNKNFNIISNYKNRSLGITLGIKNIFTYGKYLGSAITPSPFYVFSPGIGIYSKSKYSGIIIKYEYADYGLYNFNKNWITFSLMVRFNIDSRIKSMNNLIN